MLRRTLWRAAALLIALPLLLALAGCSGSGGSGASGVLRVALTDAEGPYDKVVVAVQAVRVVPAGEEGAPTGEGLPLVVAFSPPSQHDVALLAFAQAYLGEASVPAGIYNQLRLVLAPNPPVGEPLNYVTLKSDPDTKRPLDTPSGQESGLKVVGRYEVEPGTINAIALDFDPQRSIVEAGASGRYLLKPTGIRIVQQAGILPAYGSLSGTVLPEAAWPIAIVSVFPVDGGSAVASGSVSAIDGSFRAMLPAGDYALRVVAPGYETHYEGYHAVVSGADTAVVGDVVLVPSAP